MKTERITIRLTEAHKRALELESANKDIPVAKIIRELIEAHLGGK